MKKRKAIIPVLLAALVMTIAALAAAQAAEKEAPKQVLIKNVRIFDGNSDKLAAGMNILVEDNLIKKIWICMTTPTSIA